jgi:hypothetical protein
LPTGAFCFEKKRIERRSMVDPKFAFSLFDKGELLVILLLIFIAAVFIIIAANTIEKIKGSFREKKRLKSLAFVGRLFTEIIKGNTEEVVTLCFY